MNELIIDGRVIATYLGAYADITGDITVPRHCICRRGKACSDFLDSGYSTGVFCEECEHLVEMTEAQAERISKGESSEDNEGRTVSMFVDWLGLIKDK